MRRSWLWSTLFSASVLGAVASVARATSPYDLEDLGQGAGDHVVEINSVGAVLMHVGGWDAGGWQLAGAGATEPVDLGAEWASVQFHGLTNPIGSHPRGVAYGLGNPSDDPDVLRVVTWTPENGIEEAALPEIFSAYVLLGEGGRVFVQTDVGLFSFSADTPETVSEVLVGDTEDAEWLWGVSGDRAVLTTSSGAYVWSAESETFTSLQTASGAQPRCVNELGECGGTGPTFWSTSGVATNLRSLLTTPGVGDDPAPTISRISKSGWVAGFFALNSGAIPIWGDAFFHLGQSVFPHSASIFVWNARDSRFFDLTDEIRATTAKGAILHSLGEDGSVSGALLFGADTGRGPSVFCWHPVGGMVDSGDSGYLLASNRAGTVIYDDSGYGDVKRAQWVDGILSVEQVTEANAAWPGGEFDPLLDARPYVQLMNEVGQFATLDGRRGTPRGITVAEGVQIPVSDDVGVTFEGIDVAGETTVFVYDIDDPDAPQVPPDFDLAGTGTLLNISTTATVSGDIFLELVYPQGTMVEGEGRESQVRLLHRERVNSGPDGIAGTSDDVFGWVDRTDYGRGGGFLNMTTNTVYGKTPSLSPFAIVVRDYEFGGFEAPVNADGSSVFKIGKTVPLKFELTEPDGTAIPGAKAEMRLYKVSSTVVGTVDEVEIDGDATTGSLFEASSGGKYHFNLKTTGMSAGHYRADAVLDDGSTYSVKFSLR